MLKNLLYAILLGVGMAACLDDRNETANEATATDAIPDVTEELTAPAPDPADFVIAKGRVGNVQLGMPVEDMRLQEPQGQTLVDTTLLLEGQASTAYVIKSSDSPKGIVIEQLCEPVCQVWRIHVRDQDYRTAEGIGIGSKYGEVRQHYPIKSVSQGEAGLVAISEKAGLSFILDTSQLSKVQLHALITDEIPANTQVKGILVY
ncbi:mechanosensitive ion channel protein MscS [Pontibacter sp. HJ8]